ncbi:MAG TPA: tyrosine-type recombinase/integrase, partial [Pirellulales bacterium]|nr:tyrosine-type recombinase/integrase [Pirellulales bacterium]
RTPKPWYWEERGSWYVTLRGIRHNLGADRKEAHRAFHALMSKPAPKRAVRADFVAAVVDRFLDWVAKNRAPDTYLWYQSRLQLFVTRHPDLTVDQLRPIHVQEWIDSYDVASGTKRNYARAIQRAMRWALHMGCIAANPIADFQKPKGGVRSTVLSAEDFDELLSLGRNNEFRELLTFAWETGARAAECLAVERRHVDLDGGRIVFPVEEEKMERAPRVIYLSDTALGIIRKLCLRHPQGALFRNSGGEPWTTNAVNCAFMAVQNRLGRQRLKAEKAVLTAEEVSACVEQLKATRTVKGKVVPKSAADLQEEARRKLWNRKAAEKAPKYCLTVLRHSWCHHALRRGLDALTVSVLMGHADCSMVTKVYSHLSHAPDYLREAARKATT